jgi:hypothetical protein
MGAVTFSIDVALVECLREALALDVFVETGTFEGEAVERVRGLFEEVHTIELSVPHYERAKARFASEANVRVYHGDSREVLRSLREQLEPRRVLYWLDAHWCGETEGSNAPTQCPLLGELDAIGRLNQESVVLIDDARLFLATPPEPQDVADWPRLDDVLRRLAALSRAHELMVINDVITFFPSSLVARVSSFAHLRGFDLLATIHRLEELEQETRILRDVAAERLAALEEKELEIAALARTAQERLETIERIAASAEVESTVGEDASGDGQS